ncbi:MAG TPA: hypothetical protein DDW79_01570 [Anaerolineae bacterium]|nr:hypothetical protein [Anaerolineae bacterium]
MTKKGVILHEENISIPRLLVDTKNPRFPEVQPNQREAIRTMAKTQGEKVLALAHHLRDNGPNPANLLIVIPSDEDEGKYIVLDGNRRLTALKLLETPSIAEGALDRKTYLKFTELSKEYKTKPISELSCIVMDSRDVADPWIELIHRGYQSGAGLVEWDGQVAARYDARKGNKPTAFALQVLDFVRINTDLSEATNQKIEAGKFPITNLSRLINTPYVRNRLGINIRDDEIVTGQSKDGVLKGLTRVVEDLGSGRVTVSDIKRQSQRIDYINNLQPSELPQPEKASSDEQPLSLVANARKQQTPFPSPKPGGTGIQSTNRSTLIPKNCRLKVIQPRLVLIYKELRQLNLDEFINSAAVMLRVFMELSLDYFIEHNLTSWTQQKIDNSSLAQKLLGVANHFEQSKVMTKQQLEPIKKAAGGQTLLAASITTLNGYIHNRFTTPGATELKTAWDDLQPFMEKLWPA